ncbi:hypothetical protein NFX46_17030 [Streptomyces phaeoluteigriseus]|uniref:Serine/threonine protein kinase n=1 Tax=Streptomyces phaeoluteigriseus TaxID=114686 RepID=A0ABY4Z9G5_9ACTN|nr:hypothetical protein [Streptomyces phaeoluteigriseus]USQ85335.1 hypothetical protein NFX46_17030 [Streptomyces phaeoluteigriseus]
MDRGLHARKFRIAQEKPDLDGVPEAHRDLVRAGLAKDPAQRPSVDPRIQQAPDHRIV